MGQSVQSLVVTYLRLRRPYIIQNIKINIPISQIRIINLTILHTKIFYICSNLIKKKVRKP